MKQYKLIRIESSHNNVRSNEVVGVAPEEPRLGKGFTLYAESLDPMVKAQGGLRVISTTEVQEIHRAGDIFVFTTQNSTYGLEPVGITMIEALQATIKKWQGDD